MEPVTTCETCFQTEIPSCSDSILLKAGLDPNNTFTWVITDKFGNKYSAEAVSDDDGFLEIDIEELPEGLLTPFAGTFELTILNAGGETVSFIYNDTTYTCIQFTVFDSTGVLQAIIPDPSDIVTNPEESGAFVQEVEYVAHEDIDEFDIVTADGYVADSGNVSMAQKVLGMSKTTTANGLTGTATVDGKVTNGAWSWTVGAQIFLNGTSISETPPTTGFVLRVAKATKADTIVIDIDQSITL
jgi:hypothetical protein